MPRYKADINAVYISERMQECMRTIREHILTTIIAPMGYGKSTAVDWYASHVLEENERFYRVNVDSDDISTFWRNLSRGLRHTEIGKRIAQLGFPMGSAGVNLCMEMILEALDDHPEHHFLFIDDYHLMKNPQVTALLMTLCLLPVDNLHIIVAARGSFLSRSEEMELGRRLHRITIQELQLNPTELAAYVRRCGFSMTTDALATLGTVSEGWFSAAYWNLNHYAATGKLLSTGKDIYEGIYDSLVSPLDEQYKKFLEIMCLANEFTAEQAAFMTGFDNATQILEHLTNQNAFVRYHADSNTYRFHHMLRECMERRLTLLPLQEQINYAHKLAQWFSREKEYYYAAIWFERTKDWDGLLQAMGDDHGLSFGPNRLPDVSRWYDDCPQEILLKHPAAIVAFMMSFFYGRQIPKMLTLHSQFQKSMAQVTHLSEQEREALEGEVLLRLSFLKFNDISGMSFYHRQIKSLRTPERNPWTLGSPSVMFLYHSVPGNLDKENGEMRECMPIYYAVSDHHGSGAIHIMQGETDLMRGELHNAEINYQRAIQETRNHKEWAMILASEFLAARLALYQKKDPLVDFPFLREQLLVNGQYRLISTLDMAEAWIRALLGQTPDTLSWIWEEENASLRAFPLVLPIFHIIAGQTLLAQGQWSKVIAQKENRLAESERSRYALCTLYVHIQTAAAYEAMGLRGEALAELRMAFSIAAPDGILLPFAENYGYLQNALQMLEQEYTEQIAAIHSMGASLNAARTQLDKRDATDLGLSERELEIARLAAQRKSNQEIAEALYLSESTVKNHLRSIFDKLEITGNARNKRAELKKRLKE